MLEKQSTITSMEEKLKELQNLSMNESVEFMGEIQSLEKKIIALKEDMWNHLEPWDRVILARKSTRLTGLDYIEAIFDDFVELHGDRFYGDDAAIVGGICRYQDIPVTVIAEQKGRNTKDNIKRNFGMPNPEGYRKSLRLMKQAEKFNRPIICFVDTPGAFCGLGAEERGQGEAIARNLFEMSSLSVPVLSIIIGEGGSGGALALAVANEVWMLENSIYSILSPEGFASILWKDSKLAKEASDIMKITAKDLFELGIIERVIQEPVGGLEENKDKVILDIKNGIGDFLVRMRQYSVADIKENRYIKFRTYY